MDPRAQGHYVLLFQGGRRQDDVVQDDVVQAITEGQSHCLEGRELCFGEESGPLQVNVGVRRAEHYSLQ